MDPLSDLQHERREASEEKASRESKVDGSAEAVPFQGLSS